MESHVRDCCCRGFLIAIHCISTFERRYQADQIVKLPHLRHLCRYIHGNPVKDGFVEAVSEWPYSNYHEWAGTRDGTLVNRPFITNCFGRFTDYEIYLNEYLNSID